jgi:putative toxin-antitoxin system antitoxin component (TIGR02293 family)
MKYSEAATPYVSGIRDSLTSRRGAGAVVRDEMVLDSPTALISRVRRGLPIAEFSSLANWLGSTEDELAPLVGLSRATLHRRKKAGHLDAPESERLVRVTRLLARATEVFESEDSARTWLKRPALALAGESPLAFSDTEIGAREVEFLLGRLEQGVFS